MTQKRLKEVLTYDRNTGVFKANIDRGGLKKGDYVGNYTRDGYFRITIDGESFLAHRLAFLYEYGRLPEKYKDVDHINGIRHDNRVSNLREVSREINLRNSTITKNTTGVRGVTWDKDRNKWYASIGIGKGKMKYLGRFDSLEEAIKVRKKAEKELGYKIQEFE